MSQADRKVPQWGSRQVAARTPGCSSVSSAACCWCCCRGFCLPHASSVATVHMACTTARQLIARPRKMRSANDHDALAVLLGESCTSVQLTAAQRRLMLTPVNDFYGLHTSFPIDSEMVQTGRREQKCAEFCIGQFGTKCNTCNTCQSHDFAYPPF